MVRRPASASAFADVYVFPGGTVREDDGVEQPGDAAFTAAEALAAFTDRGGLPPDDAAQAIAIWRAALRELFEEAGVLLARDATGRPLQIADADAPRYLESRRALQAGQVTLAEVLARERLTLDYRQLRYFSHWITPLQERRRFNTRFFVAELPVGQTALHCQIETTDGVWVQPVDALDRASRGQFGIVFPTRRHLQRLAQQPSLDDLLAFAARKPIQTVQPSKATVDRKESIVLGPGVGECW